MGVKYIEAAGGGAFATRPHRSLHSDDSFYVPEICCTMSTSAFSGICCFLECGRRLVVCWRKVRMVVMVWVQTWATTLRAWLPVWTKWPIVLFVPCKSDLHSILHCLMLAGMNIQVGFGLCVQGRPQCAADASGLSRSSLYWIWRSSNRDECVQRTDCWWCKR